jgi:alkylated DNA repair dioxygenase AlkB
VALPQGSLFDSNVPNGFLYRPNFVTPEEETALVDDISQIEFSTFEMRGVVARRRVAFFGHSYDAGRVSPPLPAFLFPMRVRIAQWANVDANTFAMALINEYPPGAPIGWHRDAPQYGIVAGVSLLTACRMVFREYVPPNRPREPGTKRHTTHEVALEPRSAYLMTGPARRDYEHHIPPVAGLRYSITFRTLRSR